MPSQSELDIINHPCGPLDRCNPEKTSWKNAWGTPEYSPPTFDPGLIAASKGQCFDNPSPYCVLSQDKAQAAINRATAKDKVEFDKFATDYRNNYLNRKFGRPSDAALQAAAAAGLPVSVQNVSAAVQAAQVETAKAERLKTNISKAVTNGGCITLIGAAPDIYDSSECKNFRAKVDENKKKGMSMKDAIQAVLNPPKSPLAQAGQNLGKAVDANKAAQAKLGRNGSKARGGKKPDFKKQMARAKDRARGR